MRRQKFGFLHKLVLAYSVVLIIFMVILINLAYNYLLNVGLRTAAANQEQLLDKTILQVDNYFDEMDQMAQQVGSDSRVVNTFKRLDEEADSAGNYFERDLMASIDVASILASHNGPAQPIWRISVYNALGDYISSGASVTPYSRVGEHLESLDIARIAEEIDQTGRSILSPGKDPWSDVYDGEYISLIRPVANYYSTEVYGLIEIQQELAKLEAAIALDVLTDTDVYLFDRTGAQILPAGQSYSELDAAQTHITTSQTSQYGWSVSLVQSRSQVLAPYRSMLGYLYLGGVAVFAVLLTVIYLIAKRLTSPIIRLSNEVRSMRVSEIPTDLVSRESADEVKELGDAFTSLLRRLNDSLNYEKKSYLLALQAQMDPHFLYNILSVISGMGIEAESDQIVEICDKLGNMLRYSSSYDTQTTTLDDELQNAKNYLDLMKMRYEDAFSFSFELDDELKAIPMPRLILQPMLENCFEHGFKSVSPPWNIHIRTWAEDGQWCLSVSDNGAGFDQAKIAQMEERIKQYTDDLPANYHEMKIGGLGLVNTIIRLRLFSNGQVEYSIQANEPRGTVMTLKGGRP